MGCWAMSTARSKIVVRSLPSAMAIRASLLPSHGRNLDNCQQPFYGAIERVPSFLRRTVTPRSNVSCRCPRRLTRRLLTTSQHPTHLRRIDSCSFNGSPFARNCCSALLGETLYFHEPAFSRRISRMGSNHVASLTGRHSERRSSVSKSGLAAATFSFGLFYAQQTRVCAS